MHTGARASPLSAAGTEQGEAGRALKVSMALQPESELAYGREFPGPVHNRRECACWVKARHQGGQDTGITPSQGCRYIQDASSIGTSSFTHGAPGGPRPCRQKLHALLIWQRPAALTSLLKSKKPVSRYPAGPPCPHSLWQAGVLPAAVGRGAAAAQWASGVSGPHPRRWHAEQMRAQRPAGTGSGRAPAAG